MLQETQVSRTLRCMPTLAFADALAFSVMFVPLVLFKRLGLGNNETTLLTSLLFIPWLLRPLVAVYLPMAVHLRSLTAGIELLEALLLTVLANILPINASVIDVVLLLWPVSLGGVIHNVSMDSFYEISAVHHRHRVYAIRLIGFIVAMAVSQGLLIALAGNMEVMTRMIKSSWSIAFYILAALFFFLSILHFLALRSGESIMPVRDTIDVRRVDSRTIIVVALLLLMLVPEALTTQVGQLFLIDAPHNGGLGLSPSEYGLIQGTVGVVALTIGCFVGLTAINHWTELMKIVTMALAVTLPVGTYLYLSFSMTSNLMVIGLCILVKQFFLGFGLSVLYKLLLECLRSRYLSVALVTLPLLLLGCFSGALQESVGYRIFFAAVLSVSPLPIAVVAVVNAINRQQAASDIQSKEET